jgi:hypothetical protein
MPWKSRPSKSWPPVLWKRNLNYLYLLLIVLHLEVRLLCGPCRFKGNYAISSSHIFLFISGKQRCKYFINVFLPRRASSSPWSSVLFISLRRRLQAASAEGKGDLYSQKMNAEQRNAMLFLKAALVLFISSEHECIRAHWSSPSPVCWSVGLSTRSSGCTTAVLSACTHIVLWACADTFLWVCTDTVLCACADTVLCEHILSCEEVLTLSCEHVLALSREHELTLSCEPVLTHSCEHVLTMSCVNTHCLVRKCWHCLVCMCWLFLVSMSWHSLEIPYWHTLVSMCWKCLLIPRHCSLFPYS